MELTVDAFACAKAFTQGSARPLESALFLRESEVAPVSAVLAALEAFRSLGVEWAFRLPIRPTRFLPGRVRYSGSATTSDGALLP